MIFAFADLGRIRRLKIAIFVYGGRLLIFVGRIVRRYVAPCYVGVAGRRRYCRFVGRVLAFERRQWREQWRW